MAMDAHVKFALQGFPAAADKLQCRRPSWTASCTDDVNNPGVVTGLVQIKLWEIASEDGVASGVYNRAVKSLSASLARNNATAVIESSAEDAALVRCASEPGAGCTRMEFGGLAQTYRLPVSAVARYVSLSSWKNTSTLEIQTYTSVHARAFLVPGWWPGKKSLAHCGSVFGFLLDDSPLPPGESSSSALTAMAFHTAGSGGKDSEQDSRSLQEVEKGLLMLIASDAPGLQFAGAVLVDSFTSSLVWDGLLYT